MPRVSAAFGALIVTQAAHSAEEVVGRLWESFPPARFVGNLIADDPAHGFLIGNLGVVAFGLWCWRWPVRRGWYAAAPLAWGWVALELANGAGHSLWALWRGGYTPGVGTAPLLVILALYLAQQLWLGRNTTPGTSGAATERSPERPQ